MSTIGGLDIKQFILSEYPELEKNKDISITELVSSVIANMDKTLKGSSFKLETSIIKSEIKATVRQCIKLSKRKKIAKLLNKENIPEKAFIDLKEKLIDTPYVYNNLVKIIKNIGNGIHLLVEYEKQEYKLIKLDYSEQTNNFFAIISKKDTIEDGNTEVEIENIKFPS